MITKTTLTGATGAFALPACDTVAAAGRRERTGVPHLMGTIAPESKGTTVSTWTVVDNPIPPLVRPRGASG